MALGLQWADSKRSWKSLTNSNTCIIDKGVASHNATDDFTLITCTTQQEPRKEF